MTDPIRTTLLLVKQAAAAGQPINDATLLQIEQRVRHELDGERVTVSKRLPTEVRYQRIVDDLNAGFTYEQTARRNGVCRRTVFRAGKRSGDITG
ncbi:MAG: hypothetical protein HYU74_13215 [Dechloromonas sp.]|nr:hypothetical protein [Dechloromonas sp.]